MAGNGGLSAVKAAIVADQDLEVKDEDGWTPLYSATHNGHTDVAETLIVAGANVNATTNNMRTPLHKAVWEGFGPVAGLLLEAGANVNAQDNAGKTPLYYAVEYNQPRLATILMEAGADINIPDIEGQNPLDYATEHLNEELAALLRNWSREQPRRLREERASRTLLMGDPGASALEEIVKQKDAAEAALKASQSARRSLQHAGLRLAHAAAEGRAFEGAAGSCAAAPREARGIDGKVDARQDMPAAAGRLLSSSEGRRVLQGLGLGPEGLEAVVAAMARELGRAHAKAVRARGEDQRLQGKMDAAGDWTREHLPLRHSDGAAGAIALEAQLGAAEVLERLDEGRFRVVDGMSVDDCKSGGTQEVGKLQKGRARPLRREAEEAAVGEGGVVDAKGVVDEAGAALGSSIVFAIEATGENDMAGVFPQGWQGVLKGIVSLESPRAAYEEFVKQQYQWLLPALLGDRRDWRGHLMVQGHPNVLSVLHSFLGSPQLAMPWLSFARSPGALHRKATWTVTERFPTTLLGAFQKARETGGVVGGRQVALWLLQVLQALEHARSRGVVHRDVKADNVFLTADGRAVLGNWREGLLLYKGGLKMWVDRTLQGVLDRQEAKGIGDAEAEAKLALLEDSIVEECDPTGEGCLFLGCGEEAVPEEATAEVLATGGSPICRAPEVAMRAKDEGVRDAWGRVMKTAAQVYAWSDAWAAGRMVWELLAEQGAARGGDRVQLPEAMTNPRVSAGGKQEGEGMPVDLPRLPEAAGCPYLVEAILRGLLQPQPKHRLPPEQAIRALVGELYGPDRKEEPRVELCVIRNPPFRIPKEPGEWWKPFVREQRALLAEAEHAMAPLPPAALVGKKGAEGAGLVRREAASGAGADDPPPDGGAAEAAAAPGGAPPSVDELMERAVLRAAEELGPVSAGNAASEISARPKGLSMGLVGEHAFEGALSEAVGAGVLEGREEAERAVVMAGPLAVLRPPSAGTRALYGWGVEGVLGRVRPLVAGEASLWDRHLRRELLGREDAAEELEKCVSMRDDIIRLFLMQATRNSRQVLVYSDGVAGWDGPRDRRWVPDQHAARPMPLSGARIALPKGWRAERLPDGSVIFLHEDGRAQQERPTDMLPEGWVQVTGPRGQPMFLETATGQLHEERPTA